MAEGPKERLDRELIELLNELRVALPGVQVLCAFLLIVPFSQRYAQITNLQKEVYFVAVLCTALATILFIAPTALHRIEWREQDKEWLLSASNRLAIGGMILLALAMIAAIFLITDVLFSGWVVTVTTAGIAALFAVFWFALPLYRRMSNSS